VQFSRLESHITTRIKIVNEVNMVSATVIHTLTRVFDNYRSIIN